MSEETFEDLGVSKAVVDRLAETGIISPFPIQQLVLPDGLKGTDILAQSPTGSGKTLAFAIPIIERLSADSPKPSALILVPTRELCSQVTEEFALCAGNDYNVAAVYGGVGYGKQQKQLAKAQIVVATPGRLEDLADRGMLSLDDIQVLVLDEADRMLDMGFQPQVDQIVRRLPSERHTMFFSATLEGKVGRIAHKYTTEPVQHEFEPEIDEEALGRIEHRFLKVTRGSKLNIMLEELQAERGLALVFLRTKRGVDDLAVEIGREGVEALSLHGDMAQKVRESTLQRFEDGEVDILIATDVAARGLDLDDITHVVNYDPPDSGTTYTHRVGRTGRAGRHGTAITLVLDDLDEQRLVGNIARRLGKQAEYEKAGLKVLPPRMLYKSKFRGAPPRRPGPRR